MDKDYFTDIKNAIQKTATLINKKLGFSTIPNNSPFKELNTAQCDTMLVLFNEGEKSMTELAQDISLSRTNLTGTVVNPLIHLGYITKYHKANNRKTLYASLTELGRQITEELNNNFIERFSNRLMAIANKKDIEKFFESYRFINYILERY